MELGRIGRGSKRRKGGGRTSTKASSMLADGKPSCIATQQALPTFQRATVRGRGGEGGGAGSKATRNRDGGRAPLRRSPPLPHVVTPWPASCMASCSAPCCLPREPPHDSLSLSTPSSSQQVVPAGPPHILVDEPRGEGVALAQLRRDVRLAEVADEVRVPDHDCLRRTAPRALGLLLPLVPAPHTPSAQLAPARFKSTSG